MSFFGARGETCVAGPAAMKGYADGRLRTGRRRPAYDRSVRDPEWLVRLPGQVGLTWLGHDLTLAVIIGSRYYWWVIRTFRDKETERTFLRVRSRKLGPDVQRVAQRKLAMLDAAESLEDLRGPPGNRLEKLAGDREEQHSIRINDQWRVCFRWKEGNAYDVEIADYHS